MSVLPRLLPTGTVIEMRMNGVVMRGVVGLYEHYWHGQYTFPAVFGVQHHIVTTQSCSVLHLPPYTAGPRCLLTTCDLHGATIAELDEATAALLPRPRHTGRYGHAVALSSVTTAAAS